VASPESLADGLKAAILAEQAGNDFYSAAAARTSDPKGREVLLMLAAEEALHQDYLKQQYGHLIAGRPPTWLLMSSGAELGGPSPIFTEELKQRIAEAHWEMTALAVGLQLELSSINHYRSLAETVEQPEARWFFGKLVKWEENHAAAIRRQQSYLLESYWHEAGFAPF
jgi:rubrerythrin